MSDLAVESLAGKKIIALDLGRRTGWCVYCPKNKIERGRDSGVYELYPEARRKKAKTITDGQRFTALARFLTSLDDAVGVADVLCFEQVDGGTKGRQTVLYNGYRAIVLEWATRLGKTTYPVPVHTIKRVFGIGPGRTKEPVLNAAVAAGYLPFDDNEADAIGCLHTVIRLSDNPGALEAEVRSANSMHLDQFKVSQIEVPPEPKKVLPSVKKSSIVFKKANTRKTGEPSAKKRPQAKGQRASARSANRQST